MDINGVARRPVRNWLYPGFALTGLGTTMLGCLLPTLISSWHINDARAGTLFAAQFAGAALGAALVTRNYFNSVIRGYLLLIASVLLLALFEDSPRPWLFWIFGLGLGLTMTATSMLTSTLFPRSRGAALSSLNACWCLGAVVCPGLVSFWVSRWSFATLFLAFGFATAFVFLLAGRIRSGLPENRIPDSGHAHVRSLLPLITAFALVGFLYVGVETSVSGWMMAYVQRLTGIHGTLPPLAVSFFWIALLSGRAAAPVLLRRMSEEQLLNISLLGAFVAVLLLIADRSPLAIIFTATACGLILGPIYPLCLAKILALASDSPRTKWIFGVCGFGGALLPWLTGKISAYQRSLSRGLLIPLAALGLMIVVQLVAIQRSPPLRV